MKIRVYYEDTDVGGVVYHTNYLKFCERARSEMFFSKGSTPAYNDGHFVLKSLEANFHLPARFGDLLDVKSELVKLRSASCFMRQYVYRGDELLFSMSVKLGYVKLDGTIGRLSEQDREELLIILDNKVIS